MNKFTIIGYVGKPLELYNGVGVLSVSVKRDYKNKSTGEYESDWFNIKVFGNSIDVLQKYVGTGDRLLFECKVMNHNWQDKNGNKHYDNDFVLERFEFITKAQPQQMQPQETYQPIQPQQPVQQDTLVGAIPVEQVEDEDLPF